MKHCIRKVFVSSTIRDLSPLRQQVVTFLESYEGCATLRCLASEKPGFPVAAHRLHGTGTYEMCLANIATADYVVQLIHGQYGTPDVNTDGDPISITHAEYRYARERRIPVFSFIHADTWKAHSHGLGVDELIRRGVDPKTLDLVREVLTNADTRPAEAGKTRWVFPFRLMEDIKTSLRANLFEYDHSVFVRDDTIPDDTEVRVRKRLEKVWTIRNAGMVEWKDRFLQAQYPNKDGLWPDEPRIPVPYTPPGADARLSVWFTAPPFPGAFISKWKMVNAAGQICFPNLTGIWAKVNVVER